MVLTLERRFLHALGAMSTAPAIEPEPERPGNPARHRRLDPAARPAPCLNSSTRRRERAKDIDGRDIGRLDSTGAMLLVRYAMRVGLGLATVEVQPKYQSMVECGARDLRDAGAPRVKRTWVSSGCSARLGYSVEDYSQEILALIGFGGLTLVRPRCARCCDRRGSA